MRKLTWIVAAALAGLTLAVPGARAENLVSFLGGRCVDAAGGIRDGASLIAYNCHGGDNQNWIFDGGRMRAAYSEYCAAVDSRQKGAPLVLRKCRWGADGNATQNIAWWNDAHIGHNTGHCLDLANAQVGLGLSLIPWVGPWQNVILWDCHGGDNQRFGKARIQNTSADALSRRNGLVFMVPGQAGAWQIKNGLAVKVGIVAAGGGNIVAAGGGNIQTGLPPANIVAAGGGNIVAAGGGN